MTSLHEISCDQLLRQIGSAQSPAIIDVRLEEDCNLDTALNASAWWLSYQHIINTPDAITTPNNIIVSNQAHKISHGIAAILCVRGKHAKVLSGGFCAWGEKGLPVVQLQTLPEQHRRGHFG